MKGSIVLLFVLAATSPVLATAASGQGSMTGFLDVSGSGETEIVNSAVDRHTGFFSSEVLYGQGCIDYSAIGSVNGSQGISQRHRKIEFPKGLLVNVQSMESSFVFNGTGLDISNINVVSSYTGSDRVAYTPSSATFDLKSEFDGTWDMEAFKEEMDQKINARMMLDGKFEVEKNFTFKM